MVVVQQRKFHSAWFSVFPEKQYSSLMSIHLAHHSGPSLNYVSTWRQSVRYKRQLKSQAWWQHSTSYDKNFAGLSPGQAIEALCTKMKKINSNADFRNGFPLLLPRPWHPQLLCGIA